MKSLWKLFAIAALAALPSAPVWAGACAAGQSCTVDLFNVNIFNTSNGDIDIHIAVTIDNTGPTTVLTYSWVSDNLTNNPLGIDQVFWNADVLATSGTPGFAVAANCQGPGAPPCNADGFGDFLTEYDKPAGTDLTVSFTLASLVLDFPDSAGAPGQIGGEFAVHIRYSGDCSAFVSDATAAQTQNGSCTTTRKETPEPGSILLLGIGLLALGFARRTLRG